MTFETHCAFFSSTCNFFSFIKNFPLPKNLEKLQQFIMEKIEWKTIDDKNFIIYSTIICGSFLEREKKEVINELFIFQIYE